MSKAALSVQEQLAALRDTYARGLPEKLERITLAWLEIRALRARGEALEGLHRAAHSLAGSGASLGFTGLSRVARELEIYVQTVAERGTEFSPAEREHVEALISALRQAARDPDAAAEQKVEGITQVQQDAQGAHSSKVVFLLEEDVALAQDLAMQIGYFGYEVHVLDRCGDLKQSVQQMRPIAIIADITSSDQDLEYIGPLIKAEQEHGAMPPVIFISGRDDVTARLQAVRAGGVAYFTKPVGVDNIISKLDELASPQGSDPFRILVVDDEAELARYHASILESAGMLATVINDPMLVMSTLLESKPDLILMDVHMPGCTGMELASVIRQQEAYVSIPIVYLSAEADVDKQLSAMRLGGDSFLNKPIRPEHLISAVWGRVERLRVLRSFMVRDSLTGLLNHTFMKEQLALEVARTARNGTDMVFALVDIDHFKMVNDTYGHPTGDRVIKSISRLLQQRLRKSDIVGRYGGEEFAIILPNTSAAEAVRLLDELRIGFSQVRHRCEEREFYVTFSAGVAGFSHSADANQLNTAADRALYRAKAKGRNCIVAAGSSSA